MYVMKERIYKVINECTKKLEEAINYTLSQTGNGESVAIG